MLLFSDTGRSASPDVRSLARQHLHLIDARIQRVLAAKDAKEQPAQLDALSLAHLEEIHQQIDKTLKASLEVNEI
jgi:hypothetical protein